MSRQTKQPETQTGRQENPKRKITPKQIAALVCVVLLVGMYIGAFVVACLDLGDSGRLFAGCLVATIGLPILLWIYIWLYGRYTGKSTMADLFPEEKAGTEETDSSPHA